MLPLVELMDFSVCCGIWNRGESAQFSNEKCESAVK